MAEVVVVVVVRVIVTLCDIFIAGTLLARLQIDFLPKNNNIGILVALQNTLKFK